jgi:tryptophanyl-tRNA synthetase
MSKSDPSNFTRIHITTPPSEIDRLFQKAASDSIRGMYTSPDRPGITNLFQILSAFEDTPIATLEQEFRVMERWWSAAALKERTAKAVIRGLEPVRERYEQVRGDKQWLERVRREGNERAREVARERINKIKEIVGLTHD